ncbi:hypothetical protein [Parashewanella tropica]|uniref:hypothetical protein n=1 Tax=Parashewanella tropica TaxID=2547970 RepID=UPI001059624E|nr:hypothetical protein [Parashewanella tropica]
MKAFILTATLCTNAALAAVPPVQFFGDWEVLSDGTNLAATSIPLNLSPRSVFFVCNLNHQDCKVTYLQPNQCNKNDHPFINIIRQDHYSWAGFKADCVNGQLEADDTGWTSIFAVINGSPDHFSIALPAVEDSTNTYSSNGAKEAIQYISGTNNNFNWSTLKK